MVTVRWRLKRNIRKRRERRSKRNMTKRRKRRSSEEK